MNHLPRGYLRPRPSGGVTDGDGSSPFIVVGERVVPRSAYRPAPLGELADTAAWWGALGVLGAGLVAGGTLLGVRTGEVVAIGGVALFLLTAVAAGAERTELATALAVSGMVWTAAGISVVAGVDGSVFVTGLAFALVGAILLGAGIVGWATRRRRPAPG